MASLQPADIEMVVTAQTHAVFVVDDVLVQLWEYESPTLAMAAVLGRCVRWKLEDKDRPMWMMSVVGGRSSMPDGKARQIASEFPGYFDRFVMVADGTGFRAAVIRSVLTNMQLLSKVSASTPEVVGSVDDGIRALVAGSHGAVDGDRLREAITRVRSTLKKKA